MINRLTQDIIEHCNISVPISNIYDVVEKLGGRICEVEDFFDMEDTALRKQSESFVIYVNPHLNAEQKNYGVARELGHLFLHMGFKTNPDIWDQYENNAYYYTKEASKEFQANEFAEALLMPKEEFERILTMHTNKNHVDIKKVAVHFGLPTSLVFSRGQHLGYFQA